MSRIGNLIAEFCPDGVAHQPLGDLGVLIRGTGLQKSDLTEAGIPAIHYGQIHTYYGTWATHSRSFVSESLASKLRKAKSGDLVIATTSEDDQGVAKAVVWLGEHEAAVSGDAYIYRHSLEPTYVAYFFQSERFQRQKYRHITGTKVRRVSGDSLAKIVIPVPPVEIQREVVRVLSTFTCLERELVAELEARRRQYAYYRDSLLVFAAREDVPRIPLSELGSLYAGLTGKVKADFSNGNARYVSYMNVFNNPATNTHPSDLVAVAEGERQSRVRRGDILFTGSSETADEVGMSSAVTSEPTEALYLNSFCFGFRPNDVTELNPDFAKHLFRSAGVRHQISGTADGVTRINVSKARFLKVVIPLPTIDEQQRVAHLLDDFTALIEKLSAELEARRKQYEYYRDRLLTFPEAA